MVFLREKPLEPPIALLIKNKDARSRSYDRVKNLYRPGHGDASYIARYGIRDYRGGGRASARETAARVAAAAIARQYLKQQFNIEVLAWVEQVYTDRAEINPQTVTKSQVDAEPLVALTLKLPNVLNI